MVYSKKSRKSFRRPYSKRALAKKLLRKSAKRSLVKLIKKTVYKTAQTKFVNQVSSQIAFNSSIDSIGEMYPVFPQCPTGYNNDKGRVGNEITVRGLTCRGLVRISNTTTMPQPKWAYIYFLEDLHQKDATNGASTSYFLSDSGTPTQFGGTWSTASLGVDKAHFRLIRKVKVRLTQNYASGSTQTGVVDAQGTQYREFKVNIPIRNKVLKYDNTGSTTLPNNMNLLWCAGYLNYDGTIDVALQNVTVQINSMMWYKDF